MDEVIRKDDMSGEQAADFAALSAAAEEPGQAVALQEAAAGEAAAVELEDQNTQGLGLIFDLAVPTLVKFGFPSVGDVLTEESRGVLVGVWAPVLTKYGINLAGVNAKYKVEIMAVLVTWPIGQALYEGIKADSIARARKAKPKPEAVRQVAAVETPEVVTLG